MSQSSSEIILDTKGHRLFCNGNNIPLRRKPFAMLSYLVENEGELLTYQKILDNVWPNTVVSKNSIKDYVADIRKALNDNVKSPVYIQTVRGIGYRYLGGIVSKRNPTAPKLFGFIADVTPFIGRHNELHALNDMLLDPTCRLLSIIGTGGIGKTRLAEALGSRLSDSTSVAFVRLGHAKSGDVAIREIAQCLNLKLDNESLCTDKLSSALSEIKLILILDNVKSQQYLFNIIKTLLEQLPLLKVIITSRHKTGLYGEWTHEVCGLSIEHSNTEYDTDQELSDAVKLFIQAAKRTNHKYTFAVNDINYITTICRSLRGIPLALEIAAPWTKTLTHRELRDAIKDNSVVLMNPQPVSGYGDLSLLSLMQQHWNSLTEQEKTTLGVVSLFRGDCSEDALLQVSGTNRFTITDLIDKSMLVQLQTARFELHDVMRTYARRWMKDQPGYISFQTQFILYIENIVSQADNEILTSKQFYWISLLNSEMQNIREVLDLCISDSTSTQFATSGTGLKIVADLALFWFIANHWKEGINYTKKMIAAGKNESHELLCGAKLTLGGLMALSNDLTEAEVHLSQSADTFISGPAKPKARTFIAQAVVYRMQGKFTKSINACKSSLRVYSDYPDDGSVLVALSCLGQSYMEQENYKLAIDTFEHSLEIGEQVGTTISLPHTLINLARACWANKQSNKAQQLIHKCLPIAQQMGIKIYIGQSLLCLAWIELEDKKIESAQQNFCDAAEVFLSLGDQTGIAECIEGLAVSYVRSNELDLAAQLLFSSEKIRNQLGSPIRSDCKSIVESSLHAVSDALSSESLAQHSLLGNSVTPDLLIKRQSDRLIHS